MDKSLARSNAF